MNLPVAMLSLSCYACHYERRSKRNTPFVCLQGVYRRLSTLSRLGCPCPAVLPPDPICPVFTRQVHRPAAHSGTCPHASGRSVSRRSRSCPGPPSWPLATRSSLPLLTLSIGESEG